ncbi:MAG: hypothetical protein Q4A01_09880 [Coriobacteriales bacterium]|nr:hypothetical protein [Coriobacteriales bacterium]
MWGIDEFGLAMTCNTGVLRNSSASHRRTPWPCLVLILLVTIVLAGCSGSSTSKPSDGPLPVAEANMTMTPLFEQPAHEYNNELTKVAARMSEKSEQVNEYTDLRGYLESLGFREMQFSNYSTSGAFALAGTHIVVDGETVPLLVIVARGSKTFQEFAGDWTKGHMWEKTHEFLGRNAYDNVYDFYEQIWRELEPFARDAFDLDGAKRMKVLVTGHSLGGAAANMVGARLTEGAGGDGWWSGKAGQDDIYVYTFGAIKVLDENVSIEDGYENIHNVYNELDSFGPHGNWKDVAASDPAAKFGHVDMYTLDDGEDGWAIWDRTSNNHLMDNYRRAIDQGLVSCTGVRSSEGESEQQPTEANVPDVDPSCVGRYQLASYATQDPVQPYLESGDMTESRTVEITTVEGNTITFTHRYWNARRVAGGHETDPITVDIVNGRGEFNYTTEGSACGNEWGEGSITLGDGHVTITFRTSGHQDYINATLDCADITLPKIDEDGDAAHTHGEELPQEEPEDLTALETEARDQGLYVLSGVINIHHEEWGDSGYVTSITLDEPIDYTYDYKGNVNEATAREVRLCLGTGEWSEYEGRHVVVACESLYGAMHQASMQGVDALASDDVKLLHD